MLNAYGIEEFNGPQGRILYVLWEKDAISIQELSGKSGLANATLTSMLDRMEAKNLVKRLPDSHDRRKHLIALTDKAHSLRDKYDEVSKRATEIYYQGFSEAERTQLEKLLHRILDNLRQYADKENLKTH